MVHVPQSDDGQLVAKIIAGDRIAFDRLTVMHIPRLLLLARRMLNSREDAEDAVQAALASVWMARERLDPDRPVGAYLTTVTLNKCRDRLRRRRFLSLFGAQIIPEDIATMDNITPDPEQETGDRLLLRQVASAMETLPPRLYESLILVAIDGRSQEEAARILGVSKKTVETRIYRARQQLRKKLKPF